MTKKEARKTYRMRRMRLTPDEVALGSASICDQLSDLDFKGKLVHVFLPIERLNEINLWAFISHCHANETAVCTSVSDFDTSSMKTVLLTADTELVVNAWGIPEPINGTEIDSKEIDTVIVPLLYADKQGNRIGYGKGFYDRFLTSCKVDVEKIGVNYFEGEDDIVDASPFDVALHDLFISEPPF